MCLDLYLKTGKSTAEESVLLLQFESNSDLFLGVNHGCLRREINSHAGYRNEISERIQEMCPVLSDIKCIYKTGVKTSPQFGTKLDIIKITGENTLSRWRQTGTQRCHCNYLAALWFNHCCKKSINKLV
jgi:hypothetical protein